MLRPCIACVLTGAVVYLAVVKGDTGAIQAVASAFTLLAGAIWGERAALKVPGKDA